MTRAHSKPLRLASTTLFTLDKLQNIYDRFLTLRRLPYGEQRFILGEDDIIEIVASIAIGYEFPPTNEQSDQQMSYVSEVLDQILSDVEQIISKLDAVMDRLKQLSSEIKGDLKQEDLAKSLETCTSFIQWVQPKLSDDFAPNKEAIRENLLWFQTSINEVLRTSQDSQGQDGITGMFAVAQPMSVWAQVQNLLLLADHSKQSVRDQPFHKETFARFLTVFQRVKQAMPRMQNQLDQIPNNDTRQWVLWRWNRFQQTTVLDQQLNFKEKDDTYGNPVLLVYTEIQPAHHPYPARFEWLPLGDNRINWGPPIEHHRDRTTGVWQRSLPVLQSCRLNLKFLAHFDDAEKELENLS